MAPPRVPTGTYRLQLRREFGFADAAAIVPYLADLGVSHVYCSPILQAVPGSAHGYDVIDHSRLSDDLGGAAEWARLVQACRDRDLGVVVDIVPNHMALPVPERLNAAYWDLLALGQDSSYAEWFDVDWSIHGGRLLAPVLGRPLDECVRDGEVVVDTGAHEVRYFDHVFPMAPGTTTLDEQHYLLAHWRLANTQLNYRRFFDVTTLAGVRVEQPDVFAATHALIGELVHAGDVHGLRIDHPDGLADPRAYLESLEKLSGGAWTVVEKILEGDEQLPPSWACDGTTGYDAAAAVTRLLTDPAGEAAMTATYAELGGVDEDFAETVAAGKRKAAAELFPAEVDRLLRALADVVADAPALDMDRVRSALVELLVHMEVYRTYSGEPTAGDHVQSAVAAARAALPDAAAELDLLAATLSRQEGGEAGERFATRFEQTSGPVTAKGVEDTAFYRYSRLVALNEVGGDPGRFGAGVDDFHAFCRRLSADWPATMTSLSTHDTKRSEDVRARLLVLAEIPGEWRDAVRRWTSTARRHGPPDANTDYLFWQTLVGTWSASGPIEADRLQAYLLKAVKEAKQHTSWTDPDDAYEQRVTAYTRGVLHDAALVEDISGWVREHLDAPARSNVLSQKLVQLTMPGVPDVYQGQELPDLSLVDPDNRRPVDYAGRRQALADLDSGAPADPKLLVTARALRLRRDRPEVFAGSYTPLVASGTLAGHVVSFARGDDEVATVATRLPARLAAAGGWQDSRLTLPRGRWRDVLTDTAVPSGPVDVGSLLGTLPVALLVREGDG